MEKRTYLTPEIELIRLDSEISLTLQSVLPPEGPEEIILINESRISSIVNFLVQ